MPTGPTDSALCSEASEIVRSSSTISTPFGQSAYLLRKQAYVISKYHKADRSSSAQVSTYTTRRLARAAESRSAWVGVRNQHILQCGSLARGLGQHTYLAYATRPADPLIPFYLRPHFVRLSLSLSPPPTRPRPYLFLSLLALPPRSLSLSRLSLSPSESPGTSPPPSPFRPSIRVEFGKSLVGRGEARLAQEAASLKRGPRGASRIACPSHPEWLRHSSTSCTSEPPRLRASETGRPSPDSPAVGRFSPAPPSPG